MVQGTEEPLGDTDNWGLLRSHRINSYKVIKTNEHELFNKSPNTKCLKDKNLKYGKVFFPTFCDEVFKQNSWKNCVMTIHVPPIQFYH